MDTGTLNLFMKMLREDYKLNEAELQTLSRRLMADDREFDRVWRLYKNKSRTSRDGVDSFKPCLNELLS